MVGAELDRFVSDEVGSLIRKYLEASPPSELFHYTDEHAMLQIFERGRLWAGHIDFMNDFGETAHAIDLFATRMAPYLSPDGKPESLRDMLVQAELVNCTGGYLVSLSEEGDLLSQWRAYGADGRGYAVQVDPGAIASTLDLFENDEDKGADRQRDDAGRALDDLMGPVLLRCIYDDAEKEDILEAVRQLLKRVQSHAGSKVRLLIPTVAPHLLRLITLCVLAFKSSAFREEREWRLVWIGSVDKMSRGESGILRYRSSRYGLSPYLDWPIRSAEVWKAIPSVTCGPRVDRERMRKVFPQFIAWLGFPKESVELRFSEATYR